MFPLNYGAVYQTLPTCLLPNETELATDTEYPHLNSRDYVKRPTDETLCMHTSWESISINGVGHIAVATNKMYGRENRGSIWGFEQTDTLTPEGACYKLQCNALITQLQFVSENILCVALNNGNLQLWSTYSPVRNPNSPYCMFLIGEKCEHVKPIVCLDVIMKPNQNTFASGGKDCTLKIWDIGHADLQSIHTFRYAHADVITGISFDNSDNSILATCSLDKSALLWDIRLTQPAIAIYENHKVRFRDVTWLPNGGSEHQLCLGDESGFVHTVDSRLPNKFLKTKRSHDRPIRKLLPSGQKLAILADSNVVKVAADTEEFHFIYENNDSQHILRDGVWRNSCELLTVGFEGKMRTHKVE